VISRDGGTPVAARTAGPGHTGRVFLQAILNVANEPLVLSPADPQAERDNTWWLGASPHERLGLSVTEVVATFEELAGRIRARVREMAFGGTATFYVWHDEPAGQLRCATGSVPPERLRFGGDFNPAGELKGIVTEFLAEAQPGFIPFMDIEPVSSDVTHPTFDVWTVDVTAVPAHGQP